MKRIISLFLSIIMISTSILCVDLSACALEYSDDIVGVVDYSNLTQNQYISKILLNCNYLGTANDYNTANKSSESIQLDSWLNPNNVSFSRILVNALQENSDFMSSVSAWKVLTFNPENLAEDAFKEEDYYTTILLSILDAKVSDNEFIKDLNCSTNKMITSLSKNTSKILKEFCSINVENLENINVSDLTKSQYSDLMEQIAKTKDVEGLYDAVGNNIGYISDATKLCNTVADIVKTVSMYSTLNEASKATESVLKIICDNCPTDNPAMLLASKKVYKCVTGALTENMLLMMEGGEAVFTTAYNEIVSKLWNTALTTALGSFGTGVLIGQAVGKAISNFAFSTDATIDKYYAMNALVQFEDVIVSSISNLSENYQNSETTENADNYLRSVELMFSTYNLGCDYTNDFAEIVFERGFVNSVKNMFGKSQTLTDMQSSIESMKCNVELAYGLVSINTYKYYLKEDAPALYDAIYGNNTSAVIPINEIQVTQKADLTIGDEGPTYDYFSVKYLPQDNTEHVFGENVTSSDERIIKVDNNSCIGGYISVVGSGTCTLTFTTYNGKHSNSIEVTVKNGGYEILDEGTAGSNIVWHLYNNGHLEILGFGPMSSYRNGSYTSGHSPWYSYRDDITTITIQEGITSVGSAAFCGCDIDSITIPDSVLTIGAFSFEFCNLLKEIDFGNGVTRIGSDAFYKCTSLTNIVLPDSVTTIDSSFNFCENLKSVSFGKGLNSIESLAFQHCALEYLELPASVTYIDENAFFACFNLINISVDKNNQYYSSDEYGVLFNKNKTKLIKYPVGNRREYYVIPDGVVSIEMDAFKGSGGISSITISGDTITDVEEFEKCSVLKKIIIPNSVQSIGKSAFEYSALLQDITIPKSVTNIGDDAFYGCSGLTSVTIPDSVTSIGNEVFYNCKSLASVTIPNSVTGIGSSAFYGCTSLSSVTIGNSVTSIGERAFYGCTSLTSITIDNSVTSIGSSAFYGCTSLSSVTIGNSVTSIGSSAFNGCTSLTSIIIGNSVTSIGERAFYGCTSLTSIIIGNSVTSIGSCAFNGCTSLTSITIDNSVTSIESSAFNGCTSLTSVTIGNSVKDIGFRAFYDCKSLTSVTIGNGVTTIERRAFELCSSLTDVYYTGSESDWNNIFIGSGSSLTNATIHYNHIHSYNNTDIIIEPTCIEKGAKTYTCIECGAFITELIPATGHMERIIEKVDPNCVSSGYTKYKCTTCSEVYTENFKALGHNYISTGRKIEPTCTENGIEYFECSTCGEIYERTPLHNITIDSSLYIESDHNYSNNTNDTYDFNYDGATKLIITFSSETKVENNYDYIYLYDCNGSQIGKYTGTTLANHSFTIDGDSFSIKLTSDSSNTYYGFSFSSIVATVGDETATDLLAAGHNYISQVTDPTCTEHGYTTYTCECGDSYIDNYVNATGHNWNGGVITVYPSCTAAGVRTYTCTACGVTKTEAIAKTSHMVVTDGAVSPTCTETGLTQGSHCSVCGETIVAQETVPVIGHKYSTKVNAPTCIEKGYREYTCQFCSYSYKSDYVNATGHNFGNNQANCSLCGIANPNYIAPQPTTPTEPTNPTTPTRPTNPTVPTQPTKPEMPTAPIQSVITTPTEKAPSGAKKVNGEWVAKKQKNAKIKKLTKAKKSFKATWKKVRGVTGYQIQYSTSKKFTKKTTKSVTIKKNKTTSKTVKKLKAKKKYYVRIRTYKNVKLNGKTVKVYSSWSKAKIVKTK